MTAPEPVSTVSLGSVGRVVARRWRWMAAGVASGIALSVGALSAAPVSYAASALVHANPIPEPGAVPAGTRNAIDTVTETRIVTSRSVAAIAAGQLHWAGSVTDLIGHVSVSSPLDSQLLSIRFAASTSQAAADGANAFADSYLAYRKTTAQADIDARLGRLTQQLTAVDRSLDSATAKVAAARPNSPARVTLLRQRDGLQARSVTLQNQQVALQSLTVNPGQVATRTTPPSAPAGPARDLYLAAGLLLGLVLGGVAAFARDRTDDKVRRVEDLEDASDAPVLAQIPVLSAGRQSGKGAALEGEAFNLLATKLGLLTLSDGRQQRSVVLVGDGAGAARTTAWILASTFVSQGLSVALLGSGDSWPAARGDRATSGTLITDAMGAESNQNPVREPGLKLYELGDQSKLPAMIWNQRANLDVLLSASDVTVVDALNPIATSSKTALAAIGGSVVLIARRDHTRSAQVRQWVRELQQTSAIVVGAVLITPRRGRISFGAWAGSTLRASLSRGRRRGKVLVQLDRATFSGK